MTFLETLQTWLRDPIVAPLFLLLLLTLAIFVLTVARAVQAGTFDATLVAARADGCARGTLTSALRGGGCLGLLGGALYAVGDAATSAVVTGIVAIVVACGVFAVVFYVLGI